MFRVHKLLNQIIAILIFEDFVNFIIFFTLLRLVVSQAINIFFFSFVNNFFNFLAGLNLTLTRSGL